MKNFSLLRKSAQALLYKLLVSYFLSMDNIYIQSVYVFSVMVPFFFSTANDLYHVLVNM